MSNLSRQHLIKCIIEKDKYKQTQLYLKEIQLENQSIYDYINEALLNIITTNNYFPAAKLYGLRFLKDVFLSAQFHLIDSLNQNIMKHIIKTCQFDKENPEKNKRGCLYFEQVEKQKKENDTQKISYSYVLFSTQIVYVMGVWHALDQNNQTTDYAVIYEKLKKAKVPFPQNDKELKFFKSEEKDIFLKNYKEWIEKLPQIEEESEQGDEKQNTNQKSRKSIKSKQKIADHDEIKNHQKKVPFIIKDQNITSQKLQNERKKEEISSSKVTKSVDELELKKLNDLNDSKDREIISMKIKIDELTKKNKQISGKVTELETLLKLAKDSSQSQSKSEEQKSKVRYVALEAKYLTHENKYFILEKQCNQLKSKLDQSEIVKQRQSMEFQQQKQLLKKALTERSDMEEKLRATIEESNRDLKDTRQKIGRLERQIEQLNTIKKSYKKIMDEDKHDENKAIAESGPSKIEEEQKAKIEELQNQIQQTVEFYTKEIIQLKSQLNELKHLQEQNQKSMNLKDTKISSLNFQIQEKLTKISQLEIQIKKMKSENQNHLKSDQFHGQNRIQQNQTIQNKGSQIQEIHLNEIKPELKTQNDIRNSNSMSQYLKSQQMSFQIFQSFSQQPKHENSFEYSLVPLIEKVKNKSMGKTQKSEQKIKQRKQRYSVGKTFHFSNNDQKNIQIPIENYNHLSHLSLGMNKSQYHSYSNLLKYCKKSPEVCINNYEHQASFCKKSSALNLEKKTFFQESYAAKPSLIQTMIPYIENYFAHKQSMIQKEQTFFKSLCLCPSMRGKQPIFVERTIQVRLFANSSGSKEIFILQVINTGYTSMKVKAVSCHDEFKILGEKLRFINSNSTVEYQIQARNKDLNLRYPIISLIVTQDEGNRTKNLAYNVSLPLTLLEFTEMKNKIPDFYGIDHSKLKVLKSDTFKLNSKYYSLKECFPNLVFSQKSKETKMESKQKELSWQGNLLHSFIENVDTYFKMNQAGNQVSLEFAFRDYDKVSQNYAKAMIQTLMFLLQ